MIQLQPHHNITRLLRVWLSSCLSNSTQPKSIVSHEKISHHTTKIYLTKSFYGVGTLWDNIHWYQDISTFYGDTVCFLMGTSTPKNSQCRSSTQSMKFMQHVTRQSLAAVLTTHSLSQPRLQWQSPVQGNSDWLHLLRLLQLFSGSHEHFIKSWIVIVSFGRLIQSGENLPFTSIHPQVSREDRTWPWTVVCSHTWPAIKDERKICFIKAALVAECYLLIFLGKRGLSYIHWSIAY